MTITATASAKSETQTESHRFGKIITDSGSDVSDELLRQLDIGMAPLGIAFGDEGFLDRVSIGNQTGMSTGEFYRRLRSGGEHPTTSAVNEGTWSTLIDEALSEGHPFVVCVALSSKLSITYSEAVNAAKNYPEGKVFVVDSLSVSMGEGLLAIYAARLAQMGKDGAEIVGMVERQRPNTRVNVTFLDLDALRKSGRVKGIKGVLGSMLDLKPLATVIDGEIEESGKKRTRGQALRALLETVPNDPSDLVVCHADASDAPEFISMLKQGFPDRFVGEAVLGATMGTHGGIGTMGLTCVEGLTPITKTMF